MDWKVFVATFSAILLAELADKTQLVGIGMSAKTNKPMTVWLGSVCAYMLITGFSVLIGLMLAKYIKPDILRFGGATLFVTIGLLMLFGKI